MKKLNDNRNIIGYKFPIIKYITFGQSLCITYNGFNKHITFGQILHITYNGFNKYITIQNVVDIFNKPILTLTTKIIFF